uniref:Ig-like domain-containing protein n=1 Tax=Gouania willdenowi TaxID=441366 RepID=A0A8C5HJ20_GOUWI
MTCAHFVLSLICLLSIVSSSLHQESRLISVNVGDSVTLQCLYDDDDGGNPLFFWYKQSLRQEPKLISIHYSFDRKGTFHDEFKDNRRFTLKNEKYSLILTIYDVQVSDSATYYCAKSMNSYIKVNTFGDASCAAAMKGNKTLALLSISVLPLTQSTVETTLVSLHKKLKHMRFRRTNHSVYVPRRLDA